MKVYYERAHRDADPLRVMLKNGERVFLTPVDGIVEVAEGSTDETPQGDKVKWYQIVDDQVAAVFGAADLLEVEEP